MAGLHTLTWAAEHAPEEGRLLSSQGMAEVQVEQHCQETDEFTATASSMGAFLVPNPQKAFYFGEKTLGITSSF